MGVCAVVELMVCGRVVGFVMNVALYQYRLVCADVGVGVCFV